MGGGGKVREAYSSGQSIWNNKSNKFNLSNGDKTPGSKRNDYGNVMESSFKNTRKGAS